MVGVSGLTSLPGHRSEAINTIRGESGGDGTSPSQALHSDAEARSMGFTRALVPSAVLYEYLCRPAVSGWGVDWFERGWIHANFHRPVFHGQVVSVESGPIRPVGGGAQSQHGDDTRGEDIQGDDAEGDDTKNDDTKNDDTKSDDAEDGEAQNGTVPQDNNETQNSNGLQNSNELQHHDEVPGHGGNGGDRAGVVADLTCRTDDDELVATATVGLGDHPATPPRGRYVAMPPSSRQYRPVASPVAFAALDQLGSVERRVSLSESVAWLAQLSGDPGAYHTLGVAPAVDPVRDANALFEANFELGPWLHVGTEATHLSPMREGEAVSTRGSVIDVYERHDNHFAVLDLMVVAERRRPVAHLLHTVVWKLAVARENGPGPEDLVAADATR